MSTPVTDRRCIARLARFKLRVKVDIDPVDWQVRGPAGTRCGGRRRRQRLSAGTSFVVPYAWAAVTGVDLFGPDPRVSRRASAVARADAWQAIRVEAGIPSMGAELDERTIAAEAGLLERCVSFTKGCYTGQELVARLDARATRWRVGCVPSRSIPLPAAARRFEPGTRRCRWAERWSGG